MVVSDTPGHRSAYKLQESGEFAKNAFEDADCILMVELRTS
jgi:hypothetical protein